MPKPKPDTHTDPPPLMMKTFVLPQPWAAHLRRIAQDDHRQTKAQAVVLLIDAIKRRLDEEEAET